MSCCTACRSPSRGPNTSNRLDPADAGLRRSTAPPAARHGERGPDPPAGTATSHLSPESREPAGPARGPSVSCQRKGFLHLSGPTTDLGKELRMAGEPKNVTVPWVAAA